MKKNYWIIVAILVLVIGGWLAWPRQKEMNKNKVAVVEEEQNEKDDGELTPEEVIARLSEESEVNGEMSVEIVSPGGDKFAQSQARMYKAEVSNQPTNTRIECSWKFYLNQYDTEELYEEMKPMGGGNGCAFTETFIKNRGKLRVEVAVKALNTLSKEEMTEAKAERNYVVE